MYGYMAAVSSSEWVWVWVYIYIRTDNIFIYTHMYLI